MEFEIVKKYDLIELCNDLNIPLDRLMNLISGSDEISQIQNSTPLLAINVIDEFLANLSELVKRNKRSPATNKSYNSFLQQFKKYIIENHPHLLIDELNEVFLDEYYSKRNKVLKPRTLNNHIAIVRSLLSYAHNKYNTNKSYKNKFKFLTYELLPRYIPEDQVAEVLAAAFQRTHGYRWRAVVYFFLTTGCRLDELINLQVRDFNINEGFIYIRKGKRNKQRLIPIQDDLKEMILGYLSITGVKQWSYDFTGYLFAQDYGTERKKPLSSRTVEYQIERIRKKLGYENYFTVHSLRHTFAVSCLREGMRIETISELLGHSDINTTMIYLKLFPKDLREEIQEHYPFPHPKLIQPLFGMGDNQ